MVLHVEDQDDLAFVFEEAMREEAHPISLFRVSNGEEALDFLYQDGPYRQASRPELVVLDLNMPKVDGWAVLQAMRADQALCAIPVIILSTSSLPSDKAKALLMGAQAYIIKPLLFEDWVQQLKLAFAAFLPASSARTSDIV